MLTLREVTREEVRQMMRELEIKYGLGSGAFYELWKQDQSPIHGIDELRWLSYYEALRDRPTTPPPDSAG